MKTILFAIKQDDMDTAQADAFENKVMEYLQSGSREFLGAKAVHCDYKDGVLRACEQNKPDVVIISEMLSGIGDFNAIVKDIVGNYPETLVIVFFVKKRDPGDVVLANLATIGVYNWLFAPFRPRTVANLIISPKKLKDAESYIPKIVDRGNGTAFDTVLVTSKVEELDDINELLYNPNKSQAVDELDDLDSQKNGEKTSYRRVLNKNHSFTKNVKPFQKKDGQLKIVSDPIEINEQTEESFTEKKKDVREDRKEILEVNKKDLGEILNQLQNKQSEKKEKTEEIPTSKRPEALKEAEAKTEKKTEFKPPKVDRLLFLRVLPLSSCLPIQYVQYWNEFEPVKFIDLNRESSYEPYYQAEEFKPEVIRSSFKTFEGYEGKCVGDAVLGNSIEKVLDKFEHVCLIVPADKNVLTTFVKRYPGLLKNYGVCIDKTINGSVVIKEFKELCPDAKYCEVIKVEPKVDDGFSIRQIAEAECEYRFLGEEYLDYIKFIIKALSREKIAK